MISRQEKRFKFGILNFMWANIVAIKYSKQRQMWSPVVCSLNLMKILKIFIHANNCRFLFI